MKQNIIIIGAGLSGLYLAYLLQEKYKVTILEARERIGGRIHSIDNHDMGPSWIWPHQTHILELVEELDLDLFSQYTHGNALYDTKASLQRFTPQASSSSYRMQGSLTQLVETLYKSLKESDVIFSQDITKIIESEKNVEVISTSKGYKADYVISTLSPRLASKLSYTPKLPNELLNRLQSTQTWMGHSAKCVIEFEESFWRKESLSGFVFSHLGPLGEIHDASTQDKAALFGFVQANANMQTFEDDVKAQVLRLFGSSTSNITAIYLVDWRKEQLSASKEDTKPLSTHPHYGIDTSNYSKRILFSSTEFSEYEGGYLEGAVIRANMIANTLL